MKRGTADAGEVSSSFYVRPEKIHPREVDGRFARLRIIAVIALLGLYYILPWISWDDRQAVLFDLPARKFYILGWTFWPQDFFYLALLLIIAALSLFFFTTLAGRLWCGYACPQTVWTEVFMWMERWIEGRRNQRIKLDKSPLTGEKLGRKGAKHALWITFALFTGFTFVGYFTPIVELAHRLVPYELGPWESFWVFFYSFATYGNAGWMREQVCIYMCPYARFQSAMFDKDTLIISYDEQRGEPRGSRKRGVDARSQGLGDCIECKACVQVCPTGIDIRDGLQYQCIGCAACIDVCDGIMDKMNYPRGLIRYTTEQAMRHENARLLRPRIFVYASILLLMVGALAYGISVRVPLELGVIRDRNALYRETETGLVENIYTLKIANKDAVAHRFRVTVSGLDDIRLANERNPVEVSAGEVFTLPLGVQVDPADLKRTSNEIVFHVTAEGRDEISVSQPARFIGPMNP